MRSSRVYTLVAGVALLAACGGDGGTGTQNEAPTANFTFDCNALACTFTDASTDNDGTVQSLAWDFGDGATATTKPTATHTFSASNTYAVKLTATDNDGDANSKTIQVPVASAPGGPTASFDVTCGGLSCALDNTSTASGTTITYAWDFGDNLQTSNAAEPGSVTYDVDTPQTFTITLVVTADGLSSTATHQVRVGPGATLTCGTTPDCTLVLDQRATVQVTLQSHDCEAHGNTFVITQPEPQDTLFTDGCFAPINQPFNLNNGAAYDQGTQLAAEVLTGVAGSTNAQLQVTGNFSAGWTLSFDDGFVGPGEPDFNDLVILVKATPAP